jgi:beta-glucosidase
MSQRTESLLRRMTLEEKVSFVSGTDNSHTAGVPRLGIPAAKVTDGPHGARTSDPDNPGRTLPATAFPTGVGLAATWNPELIERVGAALGEEVRARGCIVMLGPCVNIHRSPLGGRNFESYSEDPYLSSRIAVAWVRGMQSRGVGACVKHFALNNQEFERMTMSSDADERTIREIYFPSFEAAVKEAGTWCVMCSYNRLDGTYAADNRWLLTEILRDEWGFTGLVMSDWYAVHSTAAAASSGLNLEMPGPTVWFGEKLINAVRNGEVSEATLDESVRRMLELLEKAGSLQAPREVTDLAQDPAHVELARETAAEAIVLLKNEHGALPLDLKKLKKLAVIGPNAAVASIQGGGSSQVVPYHAVAPLDGLRSRCPAGVEIVHEPGCRNNIATLALDPADVSPGPGSREQGLKAEYFSTDDLAGEPAMTRVDTEFTCHWFGANTPLAEAGEGEFSVRWTGVLTARQSGEHTFGLATTGRARLRVDDTEVLGTWDAPRRGDIFRTPEATGIYPLEAGQTYRLTVEYGGNPPETAVMRSLRIGCTPPLPADALERAVTAARSADAALVFAGLTNEYESEGFDRDTMDLPAEQVELIKRVAAANPRTVVVLNNGAPVTLEPWLRDVPAVVEAWYPGQEGGDAVAAVLLGEVNPSGKLPDTFPRRYEDNPACGNYPGKDGHERFAEGILVGYRHYDTNEVIPSFPFGHGLSYTTFAYRNLVLDTHTVRPGGSVSVCLEITNTGRRAGREAVQVYVRDVEARVPRPGRELKGFVKVDLKPGETEFICVTLDERALSYWDPGAKKWVAEPGEFEVLVGSSSRDIRARTTFELAG